MPIWIATRLDQSTQPIYIYADHWYDAREVARRELGTPTYDEILVYTAKAVPSRGTVFEVTWTGSGYNNSLEMHVSRRVA